MLAITGVPTQEVNDSIATPIKEENESTSTPSETALYPPLTPIPVAYNESNGHALALRLTYIF